VEKENSRKEFSFSITLAGAANFLCPPVSSFSRLLQMLALVQKPKEPQENDQAKRNAE
jgi:hypothetical protein